MRNLKRALSLVMAAAMLIGMMVVSASAADQYEDFTDKELENVSELKVYGLTVKVKYDRSVTDKHSEYGYDIYRVEDMDAFFEANKDELTKRGFDKAAFDRIKSREGGDLIYVDRKTQAVSRVSLPIPVSIERFEDDDIKAAIKN